MAHTPGPWTFTHDPDRGMSEHDDPAGARMIEAGDVTVLDGTKYYPGTPDRIEDWHLIAAAPELLASLKDLMDGDGDVHQKVLNARAAIAKAEGR